MASELLVLVPLHGRNCGRADRIPHAETPVLGLYRPVRRIPPERNSAGFAGVLARDVGIGQW